MIPVLPENLPREETSKPPKEVKKTGFERLPTQELIDSVRLYEGRSAIVKELITRFEDALSEIAAYRDETDD